MVCMCPTAEYEAISLKSKAAAGQSAAFRTAGRSLVIRPGIDPWLLLMAILKVRFYLGHPV